MRRTIVIIALVSLLMSSAAPNGLPIQRQLSLRGASSATKQSSTMTEIASQTTLAMTRTEQLLPSNCDASPQTASRSPGLASPIVDPHFDRSAAPPLRITNVYSFTGSPLITPTIDGVYTGQFVDGDGVLSPLAGVQNPLAFVDEKQFDALDNVYWRDPTFTYRSWQPLTMTLWRDGNDNGVYDTGIDFVIVGAIPMSGTSGVELNGLVPFPGGYSPLGFSPFVYNDAEFIYDGPSKANNRYDDGEDIVYVGQYMALPASVDSVAEFRGAQQTLAFDPQNPNGPPIARISIEQAPNYLYFHNDFLVDKDSPFYDFNGSAGDDGFIDGDGTTTPGSGTQDRIGIDLAARQWFTMTDNVDWYDADDDSHWTPSTDALWIDNGDGQYNAGLDGLIVYNSGVLTENLTASVLLNPATFEFVYSDDNSNNAYDNGEDIWGLSGDEIWDYNYFDNRIAWLIDGDGAATTDRGNGNGVRLDGDQWFDAEDQAYWYDANADGEWTEATDGLWKDNNLNGTYQSPTDTLIRQNNVIPQNSSANMILLQRFFVDGDGPTSNGAGSDNPTRTGQTAFQFSDNVFWYDADNSKDWTPGDSLWIDDGDGVFGSTITDTVIVSATGFVSSTIGAQLSPAAHWIGYDDGEIAYNGRYDSGEDISASNSFFAYDDYEIDPNFKYDLGEDIYDRDYLEIWVYAEGNSADMLMGGNDYAPEREPALRDIGFRVHLNGMRVDSPPPITSTRAISDYDAPGGIQAAAGWGPSRGFIGPSIPPGGDPAFGGFNRHYEYRIPRQGGQVGAVTVDAQRVSRPSKPLPTKEIQIIIELPDCHVTIFSLWKDVRRNSQGKFVGPSGTTYPAASGSSIVKFFYVHPEAAPPSVMPLDKNDLNDPYLPGQMVVPSHIPAPPPADSFFDVFFTVPTDTLQMSFSANSPLGSTPRLIGYQASDPEIVVQPVIGTSFAQAFNLPKGAWLDLAVAMPVTDLSLSPDSTAINTVSVTGTVPGGGPMPPVDPASDSLTFSPTITITLTKTSVPTLTVAPGGLVSYTIIAENHTPFALSKVVITDTRSRLISPTQVFPVDSFFDVFTELPLPELPPLNGRARMQVSGFVSPTAPLNSTITNTVTATFRTPLTGVLTSTITHTLKVSSTVPLVAPISVTINGPHIVEFGASNNFTATVTPISTTPPITFTWRAANQAPIVQTETVPIEIIALSLQSVGPQVITVTASNAAGMVTATHPLSVEVKPIGASFTGPAIGVAGATYDFTTTINPPSTTVPLRYVYHATDQPTITHTSGLSDNVQFNWTTAGPKTITVTAANDVGGVTSTHAISIYVPPSGVSIAGPTTGTLNSLYLFTATVSPPTATIPFTYVWQATDHSPFTTTGGLSSTAAFSYTSIGLKNVIVTAINFGGSISETVTLEIVEFKYVYLPIVTKNSQ
jgi:hypothetical protein